MANSTHLKQILHSVENWNKWRADNAYYGGRPSPRLAPDLSSTSFAFLREFDFLRMLENFLPHPGEINELHQSHKDGTLEPEVERSGWRNLKGDVYGVAAWDVNLTDTLQHDLNITRSGPSITVDISRLRRSSICC